MNNHKKFAIVGDSEAMKKVFDMIDSVAATDSNVMVSGRSGTGKELVARAIHANSRRRDAPFIPVNCSAFPEQLFEAELFGYEKGAFTGAHQRKLGLLELAHKGTFFLDEVCDLPVHLQAKLLRVIQEKNLRHIGGNQLIDIDVRLISASNGDIQKAREQGRMRDDFYFRINVVNIHLPALKERKEDIPTLAEYFLKRFLKSSPKKIIGFNKEAISALQAYQWPGNVRELENVVERAVALAKSETIRLADLPVHLQRFDANNGCITENLTLAEAKQKAIEEVEQKYLLILLNKHKGNVTKIALDSGMTRRNLHRLLKRYKLDAREWRAMN